MRAVVLVGGEGTRLRPLTLSTPKQMLPVAGRPVIERVVDHLARHGIEEVVLSLGYRPDAFIGAYPDGRCGDVKLTYAVEGSPLDTGGAIAFAAAEAGVLDETFVVVNGDVLTSIDVSELVAFHRSRGAGGTVALTPVEDPSRFGVVPVDRSGKVEAFIEKPAPGTAPTNMINAGIYVLEAGFLDRVPAGRRVSVEREVFPAMVAAGELYALGSQELWTDMGTPEKYLEANLAWAEAEGTLVADGAGVVSSVLGAGVEVAPGARVRGSVVLNGAKVGAGATVEGSLVGRAVQIGPGAAVTGLSVLGDAWVVPPGQKLEGVKLPQP